MNEIILVSFLSALAFLFTLARAVKWEAMIKHSIILDVSFTIILAWLFKGTYSGTLTAVLAGLWVALFFSCIKFIKNYRIIINNP